LFFIFLKAFIFNNKSIY